MNILYWILCLLIGIIPAYFVYKKDKQRSFRWKGLPAFLRFLTFFLTAALLLAPAFPNHKTITDKPIVIWLQDQSSSMKRALGKDSTSFQKQTENLFKDQNTDFKTIPLGFGTGLNNQPRIFRYDQSGTDIATALQEAQRRYQNQNIGAFVVVSDGNYNTGSNPIYALPDNNIPIYTVGIGDSTQPRDLVVSYAHANKRVTLGNSFELMANIHAQKLSGQNGSIRILHQGKVVGQQNFSIQNNAYNGTFRFYIPANQKGLQRYTVSVAPISGEQNLKNNQRDVFVDVLERQIKILIAAAAPNPDIEAIKEALKDKPEYKISIDYAGNIPLSLSGYDLLITHDLPSLEGYRIPVHGQIPVWYILGGNTNLAAFSKEQDMVQIQGRNGFDNIQPQISPVFNYFPLPEDIRAVIPQMPPLKSPMGIFKLTNGQPLLLIQGHNPEPLWVVSAGAHPKSLLLGTGIWRWRLFSFRFFKNSNTIDQLIEQNVNLLTQQNNSNPFQITLPKFQFQDHEPITIGASLRDPSGNLTNSPEAVFVLKDSTGKERKFSFSQSGKSYQLSLGALPAGDYSYTGKVVYNNQTLSDAGSFNVQSVSLEDMKTFSDYAVLYRMSANTHGKFFTLNTLSQLKNALEQDKSMKPVLREETQYLHWIDLKWLFLLILLTATGEWLLRKYWGL